MTNMPCTKLLHLAVSTLFDDTRSLMAKLLQNHRRTGRPMENLLSTGSDVRHFVPAKSAKHLDRASPTKHQDDSVKRPQASLSQHDDDAVLVAESPTMTTVKSEPSAIASEDLRSSIDGRALDDDEPADSLIAELQALRGEIQVLWQAIDELREWADHTLRNPPETEARPLRIWSLATDPAAKDFGQRINAIPSEQMDALRQSLTPSACEQPAAKASGQQTQLF